MGLGLLGCILVGCALGYVLRQYLGTSKIKSAQEEAERIVSEAETKRKEMFLEVKTEALSARREGEEELKQRRRRGGNQEERLQKRQEALERRVEPLEQRERQLSGQASRLKEKESELEETKRKRIEELQAISRLSQEEAKQLLLQAVEGESRQEMARG